jgi:presenilin-like A22 family membrane protease
MKKRMKHNFKITAILIFMFLITQLIGLFIIGIYSLENITLPYGFQTPENAGTLKSCDSSLPISEYFGCIITYLWPILIAFVIAIGLFFFLTRFNAAKIIRTWFFIVVIIALSISFTALLRLPNIPNPSIIALILAFPLAYLKIFKRNLLVHNITELLIYPGIAAVLIPILNIFGVIIILLIISLYDIWAVWHSEFMQKIAKYQINNLRIFSGFFIPYATKRDKIKIKEIKQKYKNKSEKEAEKAFRKSKVRISLAILGGGDVIFPIIAAGVFYQSFNSFIPALLISLFSTLALLSLFVLARKGKFYPAMPFITIGIYLGMILSWILAYLNLVH